MRRQIILAAMSVGLLLTACNGQTAAVTTTMAATEAGTEISAEIEQNQPPVTTASQPIEVSSGNRVLVAYFSRAENIGGAPSVDAVSSASINMRDGEVTGNMKAMAEVIQELTSGDIFSIQTEHAYSPNYRESTNEAREELNSNARPALTTHVENMSQYDVIYVGYPNWWGTIPTAVSSFLEEYDFSGKTIIPFCSHEGSGLGSGESAIRELCPEATLLDGYAVRGSRAVSDETRGEIADWLQEIGQK